MPVAGLDGKLSTRFRDVWPDWVPGKPSSEDFFLFEGMITRRLESVGNFL